jgi:aminocarboxymuconate-semialdehyde decarboxylase
MIIDSHAHFVPPALLEEIADTAADFPALELVPYDSGFGFSFAGAAATRPVSPLLSDVGKRLDWMDQHQIDHQVVGGWLDMFGYEMPAEDGERWSRLINKHLGAFAAAHDGRFIPLASLPMQDGAAAARVLDDAHKAGFKGAMIGTQPHGSGGVLDDPALTPFWQAAERNQSILFIHPVFDSGDKRVDDYGMNNAIGRITDTLIAIARIIYSGHVQRYQGVRIVIGIGGAGLPYVLGRMRRNYNLHKDSLADPQQALSLLYYDSLLHDPAALQFLIESVGSARIMLGSDMPFPIGDPAPLDIFDGLRISASQKQDMLCGVAKTLFGL